MAPFGLRAFICTRAFSNFKDRILTVECNFGQFIGHKELENIKLRKPLIAS